MNQNPASEDLKIKMGTSITSSNQKLGVISPKSIKNPEITADQVTPEVAAQIVKKFILPMFEGKLASKAAVGKVTSAK